MKRKNKWIIVTVSSMLTIVTLFATLGKPKYMQHCHHYGKCEKSQPMVKH